MSNSDVKARYDEFQQDAVAAVVRDFDANPVGRYLLVIPTGGGKTFTAVKSVCEMFRLGQLDSMSDKVLWVAHRTELIEQASNTFKAVIKEWDLDVEVGNQILIEMVLASKATIESLKEIKLVVIDEAHHAAANSYGTIFSAEGHGVLGLTATPSRHDGKPLEFQKESYSIGFPDLVRRGIILRPKVHKVDGGSFDIDDFSDDELEKLNSNERNQKIVNALRSNLEEFKKVIVYVGTKKHAVDLCEYLKNTDLVDAYDSVAYITGGSNSRSQDRADFIAQEKGYERSILVNVQVLSEGYDDPTVNTVVMAAPSKSKLYYMQAMGRAIRQDPNDPTKCAHVVEVIDDLPNIRYRIDNRWLYSDISDALEPAVVDYEYSSESNLGEVLDQIYDKYAVAETDRKYPEYDSSSRYSLLLFSQYESMDTYNHRSVILHNENRIQIANAYNFLSERMQKFVPKSYSAENVFKMVEQNSGGSLFTDLEKRSIYDAMSNAYHAMQKDFDGIAYVEAGKPWITFVSLNYRSEESSISEELLEFVADMTNREEVVQRLLDNDYAKGDVLLRLPQPLSGFVGLFVTLESADEISEIVMLLSKLKDKSDKEQMKNVNQIIHDAILPVETKYGNSLVNIARDSIDFRYDLIR